MDVNQVLQGTLSPDASIRHAAESQLSQAAEADFSGYLTILARELANDTAPSNIRVAAGLALKNAFTARDSTRLRLVQERWLSHVDSTIKFNVKELSLKTLASNDSRAGQAAAQFIASIASIEIPHNQWPDLMESLVRFVSEGGDHQKQASLTTIGYICETHDATLRSCLTHHSNAILTAVVQGARKEEPNNDIRHAAISALSDSLEFIKENFENEGERNFIMQVICEATQANDSQVQQGAYGCLNRIMALYYDKMRFYMEKALFGLTIQGMRSDEEDVAKLAVEFWCTVCEEEISIQDDNVHAQEEGTGSGRETRPFFNFAGIATPEVVPVLLELMTKQDEDASEDEYNLSRAAYQCLQLWAQAVGDAITTPVLIFVDKNLQSPDWHLRDASVSAFGAIMEGPDEKILNPLVKQALPVLIGMLNDQVIQVRDSAAYALGRICESLSDAIEAEESLSSMISALFSGIASHPRMASSCCWALMNLVERFSGTPGCDVNPLSEHFNESVTRLLNFTERVETDGQLRFAAYELLNTFILNSGNQSLPSVAGISNIILERLQRSIDLQRQVISVEDKMLLEDMQTSLISVIIAIIQRLEADVKPQSQHIMQILLQLLNNLGSKSSVTDIIFNAIGALATVNEQDFQIYMDAFTPFLYNALSCEDDQSLCSVSIGLLVDITRALGESVKPYCDTFMNYLLTNLRNPNLNNMTKPYILECFGDIAQAVGGYFENYLSLVVQVLLQASSINPNDQLSLQDKDYLLSLREAIIQCWDGIILSMKSASKENLIFPHVESIFKILHSSYLDPIRPEALVRASLGLIGDLADSFPNGELAEFFSYEWVTSFIKEVRSNKDFQPQTLDTARWARDLIKRQLSK